MPGMLATDLGSGDLPGWPHAMELVRAITKKPVRRRMGLPCAKTDPRRLTRTSRNNSTIPGEGNVKT
jgi:hypothetical protein